METLVVITVLCYLAAPSVAKFRFPLVLHEQGAWTLVILHMEPASSSRASVRGTRIDTSSSR